MEGIPLPGSTAVGGQGFDGAYLNVASLQIPVNGHGTLQTFMDDTDSGLRETGLEGILTQLIEGNQNGVFDSVFDKSNFEEESDKHTVSASHDQTLGVTSVQPMGFYDSLISGNMFNISESRQPFFVETKGSLPTTVKGWQSKTTSKTVGSEQNDDRLDVEYNIRTEAVENDNREWSPLTMDPSTVGLFLKEQSRAEAVEVTTKTPEPVYPFPASNGGGSNSFNSNANVGQYHPDQMPSYGATFDPNTVNSLLNLYQPDSSFKNFITQTGSNPANTNMPSNFDADALNKAYMDKISDTFLQAPPGVSPDALQSTSSNEDNGFQFSAYPASRASAFDASALNQALMNNQRIMQSLGPPTETLSESNVQPVNVLTSQNPSEEPNSDIKPFMRKTTRRPSTTEVPTTTKEIPYYDNQNFIPGNLYPGQGNIVGSHELAEQEAGTPSFLRNLPIQTPSFNPNLLNAAQNIFNPNSVSWIRTRDLKRPFPEDEVSSAKPPNSTVLPTITTSLPSGEVTDSTQSHEATTLLPQNPPSSSTNTATTQMPKESQTSAYLSDGFNPNKINSNQGQGLFVPGQISGYFGGIGNDLTGKNLGSQFTPGGNSLSMNFDTFSLLGLGKATGNVSSETTGQNLSMFDVGLAGTGMGTGNGSKDVFGKGVFSTASFDPNAANKGFGNVLSGGFGMGLNNSSSGFSMGGFDPNAANTGFGQGGFGMPDSEANAYTAAFDPNKINFLASSNPYQDGKSNGSSNSDNNITGNFLGMISKTGYGNFLGDSASPYISAFNPDTVNQASYNPDDFNKDQMHFTPLDMLSSNPGIDKGTLMNVASAFDPVKANKLYAQQFSPLSMLSSNPGIDKNALMNLVFNQGGDTDGTGNLTTAKPRSNDSSNGIQAIQGMFDPVQLMAKLMQGTAAFTPGFSGMQKQSFEPDALSTTEPAKLSSVVTDSLVTLKTTTSSTPSTTTPSGNSAATTASVTTNTSTVPRSSTVSDTGTITRL